MKFRKSSSVEPHTILFATIPFEYLADTAAQWAAAGVRGFMLGGVMSNWDSDVWLAESGRLVGERNPLYVRLKRMNEACVREGVDRNFIKVAFYTHLPDWFDDGGWARLCENFRQAAILARDGLFRGIAIDIEYISETYDLDWEGYRKPDYPAYELRGEAKARGAELVRSMLDEYPSMELLHLPEGPECYGPLASDLFEGMVTEMHRRKAPGGLHLLTESSYTKTDTEWLMRYAQQLDEIVQQILPASVWPYWRERCSIAFGLWPLGYYREIFDSAGSFLGYGGKKEKFGDQVVGSYADKSENYSVEEFRRQLGISRMLCRRYVWVYCHGSTLWQFGKEEMARYGGHQSDALPVVPNLDSYLEVLSRAEILSDRRIQGIASKIRNGLRVDFLTVSGSPRFWHVIGPFDNSEGKGFGTVYAPEQGIDLGASYEWEGGRAVWQRVGVGSTGYVDLRRLFRPSDYRCAYALCHVALSHDTNAVIHLGSDDGAKVWVEGRLVFELDITRGAEPDQNTIDAVLRKGRVPILLKVVNRRGSWGFYFRVTDEEGRALRGASWSP